MVITWHWAGSLEALQPFLAACQSLGLGTWEPFLYSTFRVTPSVFPSLFLTHLWSSSCAETFENVDAELETIEQEEKSRKNPGQRTSSPSSNLSVIQWHLLSSAEAR
ncbi:hypothetical protein B0H17DRAFT_1149262 [Mycena rosella]|uniref:Uncharacterized protein n=1 Tax=Mycena rosella TaxID=1033263 RepID=A0AAD7C345_MYCRO|nr:hypothetical protein B0H17DRAFT_1149262 [Mycena rosella]